jgi:hypothetical protein
MIAIEAFRDIRERFPECDPALMEFPSGLLMLDLSIAGVRYCALYLPSHNAFGLSKVEGSSPFWEGVDESFETVEELEARIAEMVKTGK